MGTREVRERVCWGVGIVVLGVAAYRLADDDPSGAALLAATLGVVIWYTVETQRLRVVSERTQATSRSDNELHRHPWLHATDLRPEIRRHEETAERPELVLYLPIGNRGDTPAADVQVRGQCAATYPNDPELRYDGEISYDRIFLAPGDTAHARLARVPLLADDAQVAASATIQYRTLLGGRGLIEVTFLGTIRGLVIDDFHNGPMRYIAEDSGGRQYGDVGPVVRG